MVRRPFYRTAPHVASTDVDKASNMLANEPVDRSCPSYHHGLEKIEGWYKCEEAKPQRPATELMKDNAIDGPIVSNEKDCEGRPEWSCLSALMAFFHKHGILPTTVVGLDDAGSAWVMTSTLESPRSISQPVLYRGIRQGFSKSLFHFDIRDSNSENDRDERQSLLMTTRARESPCTSRHPDNKRSLNSERLQTSPASDSKRLKQRKLNEPSVTKFMGKTEAIENIREVADIEDTEDLEDDDGVDYELHVVDDYESATTETKNIRVDSLQDWYDFAFRSMSQLALKDIAKAWIKTCVPKKQTHNPYNGGAGAARSMAEYGYKGHDTLPIWWPSDEGWDHPEGARGCRHREPDHIRKRERLILLPHLLRYGREFDIDLMEKSTSAFAREKSTVFPPKTVQRLDEVYRVRQSEIRFEQGEIDAAATVCVPMPLPKEKGKGKGNAIRRKMKVKKSNSVKAESPPPQSQSQAIERAPVANMGGGPTDARAAKAEEHDEDDGILETVDLVEAIPWESSLSVSSPQLAKTSERSAACSSINRDLPPAEPGSAQKKQALPFEPFRGVSLERQEGFPLATPYIPAIVDSSRILDGRVSLEQKSLFSTEPNIIRHAPAYMDDHSAFLTQDRSAFLMPPQRQGQSHGRNFDITHRPHLGFERINEPGNQVQNATLIPTTRQSSPRGSLSQTASEHFASKAATHAWVSENTFTQDRNHTNDYIYNNGADPNAVLTSSAGTSFSSDLTDFVEDRYHANIHDQPFIVPSGYEERSETEKYKLQYPTLQGIRSFEIPFPEPATPMYLFNSVDIELKYNPFPPGPCERRL